MFKPGQLIEFRSVSVGLGTVTFKLVNSQGWHQFPTASVGMYVGPAAEERAFDGSVWSIWRADGIGIVLVDDKLLYVSHEFIKVSIP